MNDASIAQIFPNESDPQIIYIHMLRMCMYNVADSSVSYSCGWCVQFNVALSVLTLS